MNTKLSEARKKFIAKAQSTLGRVLNADEAKAVRGFDERIIEIAVESLSQQKILGMVYNACGNDRSLVLLEHLASEPDSLTAGRQVILEFLEPKARKEIEKIDLDSELERLSCWFLALLRSDPLPARIRALNFGLFESDGGCSLYVTGANTYDAEDSDWACANDWYPEGRYAPLGELPKLYRLLRRTDTEPWLIAQAIAILLVRMFFQTHASEVKNLCSRRKLFVSSGFDDGDLYAIKTPMTPKA